MLFHYLSMYDIFYDAIENDNHNHTYDWINTWRIKMKKIVKILMITALVSVFAVGCSTKKGNGTTGSDTATPLPTKEAEAEHTQQDNEQTDDTQTDNNDTDSSAKEFPYTYVDAANREIVIEKEVTKVATDYLPLWETLYLLGITPVAASSAENYLATWDAFSGADMGDIIDLGTTEVNLELLLEVEPDLFLHQVADPSNIDVANYEKISPVAVFGPATKMDWKLSLREVGKLLGREEKAEEVIAAFDQKIADARVKLQEAYEGATVLQMSIMGADRYFCAYRPVLYDKETGLGLNAPEGYTTSEGYEQISIEALVEMNPDYIFVNVFDGDEAIFEELQNNSVWQSLKAVKEGHVTRIDGSGHAASGMATQYTVGVIVDTLLAE